MKKRPTWAIFISTEDHQVMKSSGKMGLVDSLFYLRHSLPTQRHKRLALAGHIVGKLNLVLLITATISILTISSLSGA
jgi:hypothetical protein